MPILLTEPARSAPLAFNQDEAREFVKVLANRKERNRDCCRELNRPGFRRGSGV